MTNEVRNGLYPGIRTIVHNWPYQVIIECLEELLNAKITIIFNEKEKKDE